MPQYFFHIHKDSHRPDTTGMEFPGISDAQMEAALVMAKEMKDHPGEFWNDEEWHIEVTDERGLILFSVYSSAVAAASTRTRETTEPPTRRN